MRIVFCVFVFTFLSLMTGCGKRSRDVFGAAVKGAVVSDGAPLKIPPNTAFSISFVPSDFKAKPDAFISGAPIDPATGAFEIPQAGGLQGGEYKVTISATPVPDAEGKVAPGGDMFKDKFSFDKTPLVASFPASGQISLTVDVAKSSVEVR